MMTKLAARLIAAASIAVSSHQRRLFAATFKRVDSG